MKRKLNKRQWLWEFSKRIVVTVTVIFVAVIFYACMYLWINPDSSALISIIENMSDIFKVTVVAYAVKAGFENIHKIKKNGDREESIDE